MLVAASCVHWDETIARYNLAHKNTIPLDVKFLLSLSDKTLPLIEKNQDVLNEKKEIAGGEGEYLYRSGLSSREVFELRKKDFFAAQQTYSWLSWNVSDAYVKQHIPNGSITSSMYK